MSTKKELVLKAFHNEQTERVPVGFWFHFLKGAEFQEGLHRPELLEKNLAGHKKFAEELEPDFVKIMTDGYFFLPFDFSGVHTAEDLRSLKPTTEIDRFLEENRKLVQGVRQIFGEDILLFFNVFSPLNHLLSGLGEYGNGLHRVTAFLQEDAGAVEAALNTIADGIVELIRRVVKPGLADGIYLSVNNPNRTIPAQIYATYIVGSERKILEEANQLAQDHILHICGYEGNKNILSLYRDYPASVINWAVHTENLGIREGKEYFGNKAVIGGFSNDKKGLLYSGTREEIEAYVEQLLQTAGDRGIILGADCTVPSDIAIERLQWVRDYAAQGRKKHAGD